MKRAFSFMLMFAVIAVSYAKPPRQDLMDTQRCAVMEFRAGAGISQSDVDGISAIFITYFRPEGYTMVERTQIDRVIDEQGFQRSSLTEYQMVRIGEILNVSKIVVGDVNVVMGQYNVDARVINVESGNMVAAKGATFNGSSYRSSMQSLAQSLASSIAITSGGSVSVTSQQQRNEPYIIYGYLKVFPTDLGTFESEPKSVIERLNQALQYGYGTWRLPTNEELALMRANNIIGSGSYMTKENQRGIVRLVTDKEKGEIFRVVPRGYVDLGLPSGTLWKKTNEDGLYTYKSAIEEFGNKIPSKEQFEELLNSCQWIWNDNGYQVVGPNGEAIFLPAEGYRYDFDRRTREEGETGRYWSSSTPCDGSTWDKVSLRIHDPEICNKCIMCAWGDESMSVRLVQ